MDQVIIRPVLVSSFEKRLFQITIFLIPTNLAYHFITNQAYVNGILVDYLIPKLYLSDLPILLLLFLWIFKSIAPKTSESLPEVYQTKSFTQWPLLLFISAGLILFIKTILSAHPLAGIWYILKLLELSLFFFWIKKHLVIKIINQSPDRGKGEGNNFFEISLTRLKAWLASWNRNTPHAKSSEIEKKFITKTIALPLIWAMLFQSLLALYQFLAQHSLAGYWFFGEATLTFTANIAKAVVWPFAGLRILPYGTTSHPNVLAGFLAVGLVILISHWRRIKLSSVQKFLVLTFALLVIYLTQSLTAWFALAVGLFILFQPKVKSTFIPIFLFSLTLFMALYLTPSLNFSERWCHPERVWQNVICQTVAGPSFTRRQQLNYYAWQMFLDHPLFGIGLNQFTAVLPAYGTITAFTSFLQPVHNIYFLWLAETGLLGIIVLLLILRRLMMGWYFLEKTRTWLKANLKLGFTHISHIKSFVFEENTKPSINPYHSSEIEKKFITATYSTPLIIILLLIGLADHYPLTLQTGQLLFILSLALRSPSKTAS